MTDKRSYPDCVDDTYIDCVRDYSECVEDVSPPVVTPPAPYRNDDVWYKEIFYKVIAFFSRLFGRLGL
jgi:hypothetical protein